MKMIMAVAPRDEAERVLQALVAADHTATYLETRGGMLRQAQMTLFVAVDDQDLEKVLRIIAGACRADVLIEGAKREEDQEAAPMPIKPRLGGAVVFVWEVERSETY